MNKFMEAARPNAIQVQGAHAPKRPQEPGLYPGSVQDVAQFTEQVAQYRACASDKARAAFLARFTVDYFSLPAEVTITEPEVDAIQAEVKPKLLELVTRATAAFEAAAAAEDRQAAADAPQTLSDGVYLVGTDIRPGRYKGAPTGSRGAYWQISRDANGADIIQNGLPRGQFYVQVKVGQFLDLRNVRLVEQR